MVVMQAENDDIVDIFFELLSEETGKDHKSEFLMHLGNNQRLGQAFMNSLPPEYFGRLNKWIWCPWESTRWKAIYDAIDYLTK